MQKFELNGIDLRIPDGCLSPALVKALQNGRYEHSEAAALARHLKAGDRVLDIGAGAEYLSALAARSVGGDNVVAVEAHPQMVKALRANLTRNGAPPWPPARLWRTGLSARRLVSIFAGRSGLRK